MDDLAKDIYDSAVAMNRVLAAQCMRTPERNEYFEKVAAEVIEKLDLTFSRAEVIKISEWVQYLSTQD
jgi:hypothetical protein